MTAGDRLVITDAGHPWAGHSGVIVDVNGNGNIQVRLDAGPTVYVWVDQWVRMFTGTDSAPVRVGQIR